MCFNFVQIYTPILICICNINYSNAQEYTRTVHITSKKTVREKSQTVRNRIWTNSKTVGSNRQARHTSVHLNRDTRTAQLIPFFFLFTQFEIKIPQQRRRDARKQMVAFSEIRTKICDLIRQSVKPRNLMLQLSGVFTSEQFMSVSRYP